MESTVRPFLAKSIFSLMRQESAAKVPTMSSVDFTSWRHTGSVKRWHSSTLIIALAKIKTTV
jgi:hypothetical protein